MENHQTENQEVIEPVVSQEPTPETKVSMGQKIVNLVDNKVFLYLTAFISMLAPAVFFAGRENFRYHNYYIFMGFTVLMMALMCVIAISQLMYVVAKHIAQVEKYMVKAVKICYFAFAMLGIALFIAAIAISLFNAGDSSSREVA